MFAAHGIDGEVARNGEEPGAECIFVVELVSAFEDADPGFLEEVFGQFAASGQVHEVAEKAMLVLLDEAIEQVRISTSKSASDLGALLRHRGLEIESSRVHTTGYTGAGGEKTQGDREGGPRRFKLLKRGRIRDAFGEVGGGGSGGEVEILRLRVRIREARPLVDQDDNTLGVAMGPWYILCIYVSRYIVSRGGSCRRAIDVAEADSEYTTDDTATVTVGAATLESVGDISIGAQDSATVATDANAKTYGLAAAAEGNSNSDVTSTNKVEIGNGATLDAGGNVNLDAGQTTSGTTNDFDLTAYTNLWNKTAFPITTKPNAYGTLNQYNQVLVDSGGLVETVKDAYLTATPGAHTVTAYGDGKDLYREACSARSAAPSARPSAAAACRWTSPPARPRTTPAAAPPP